MDKDSKFTRDDNGNIAVRVFAGGGVAENPDYMFTRDDDGNIAVRVVFGEGSSGGGDSSNLGYFATLEALQEAYPTAEPGNWAIVGTTDTVWVWDEDTTAWVDTDQKGQVTSVNNKTGAVVLSASDVGAATAAQGAKADTAIQSVKTINGQSIVGEGNVDIDGLPSQTGNAGKFLKTDGTGASWGALSSKTTATLLANGWTYDSVNSRYEQTVNVAGVTASNDVEVSPYAVNYNEWGNCGVFGAAQAVGTITFWADSEPTNDLQFTAIIRA